MAARNETAKATIYLDGKQAEAALDALKNKAKDLRKAIEEARKAGDDVKLKKLEGEVKNVEQAQRSLRRETYDYERVLKNLNGSSLNDLRKALRTVDIQMGNMSRKDPGFTRLQAQARLLRTEINSVNNSMRAQEGFFSRVAGGINKYFTVVAGALAGLAGISLTVKNTIKAYAEFDDKLADVMKTTGLTKDQVTALNDELKKIDTRTSQLELLDLARVAGKLGISAEKDVLEFVRAADKIKVALSEDLGGNVEESINQIGKLVETFKLKESYGIETSMLKVGSAINSLGAASTANEGFMVEFGQRVAGIAPLTGISIQNVLGLAATFDQLGQTAEVSGTVFNQVISNMFKDTGTYAGIANMKVADFTELLNTDANEAFLRVLDGLKGNNQGFTEMAKRLDDLGLDGARATAVLGVLANNTKLLRDQQKFSNQEFAKGNSLITEFNTKNSSAQAELEKAKKAFQNLTVELGQKLTPAYTSIISKSKLMIEALMSTVNFITKYSRQITTLIVSIASYTIAVKLLTLWESRKNKEVGLGLALSKLSVFWANAQKGATILLAGAKALLTGNITRATAAMRLFGIATKMNPVGLLISLLTTAVVALNIFRSKSEEATQQQKLFNDEIERGNELMGQNKTLTERASIIKNLSKQQLETLQSDLQTQISSEEDFHATLLAKLKKRLDEDEILRIRKEKATQKGLTQLQYIYLGNQVEQRKRLLANELEDLNKSNQKRLSQLKGYLKKVQEELNGKEKEKPPTPPAPPSGDKKTTKDIIDSSYEEQLLNLKLFYSEKEHLQKEYHARELALEIAHLKAIETLEGDKSEKVKLQQLLLDKQREYGIAIRDAVPEIIKNEKANNSLNNRLLEQDKLMALVTQRQEQADQETQTMTDTLVKQGQVYQVTMGVVSQGLFDMMSGQEDAFQSFAKNIIIFALEQLKLQAELAAAGVIIQSLASPESIATLGAAGIAKAAIIVGLIEAAFAVVEGLVNRGFTKKGKKGYAEGGYTGSGDKEQPAGVVHAGEWVAPREMVKSKNAGPVIKMLEEYRVSGNFSRVSVPRIEVPGPGYATGGFVQPSPGIQPSNPETDQELRDLLKKNNEAINRFMLWRPTVYTELIKKDLDTLDKINRNRSM